MSLSKNTKSSFKKLPDKLGKERNFNNYYFLIGILIFTLIIYSKYIYNDFIFGWDDDVYVSNNADIRNLTFQGIKNIFSRYYIGLYLPITMITYALEYKVFGINPFIYHLDNIILHILNTALVFIFINKLLKKSDIALLCSVLFAIHPMHVESVAWIAERKDVLYTFFYLASLILYLNYFEK